MLSKFYCCAPLRIGCIILSVLAIIVGVGILVVSEGRFWTSFFGQHLYSIVLGIFLLITFTPLLFGAIKNNANAVMLSLVLYLFTIIIMIVTGIMAMVRIETFESGFVKNCTTMGNVLDELHMTCDELKSRSTEIVAGANFSYCFLGIYYCICIYSFYKELKGGDGSIA